MKRLLLAAALAVPAAAQELPSRAPTTELDRGTPVQPGDARTFQVPPLQEANLKGGMKLALEQVSRLPIVSVRVVLPYGGSAFEPAGKTGLATVVASLMSEGTRNLPGAKFAEKLDDLGAMLSLDAQPDAMVATLFTTKENLDKAMGLMADMVRSPALAEPDFQRIQQEFQVGLQSDQGDPGKLSEKRLDRAVFAGHAYGRSPDAASVAAVTHADVKAFAASNVRPENAVIAAAGDLDMPEFKKLAEKHFGSWKAAGGAGNIPADVPVIAELDPSVPAAGMKIDLIDLPSSQQSAIRVGHRSISRDAPDYFPTLVMNYILGQMPITGRLEKNLREDHGWAYGACSCGEALKRGGSFVAHADVQTDATALALKEMLAEFQRMRETRVPAEELASVKRFMAGIFVLRQQTVQSIAAQVAGIELYGLSKDALAQYRDKVMAVTADQVQAAALAHLRAGDLRVVVAGDAARVQADLGQIAPVTVVDQAGSPKVPGPTGPNGPRS